MGLLSIFQRQTDTAADAPAPDAVAAARARARRRLIGAAVLLGIGVVGFPLLFETQPRPVPVNIPIEIPRKDGAPPLAPPGPSPALSAASAAVVLPDAELPSARPAEITERAADAGRELPPPAPAPAPAPAEPEAVAAAPKPPATTASKSAVSAARPAPAPGNADGARALALLNGRPAAAAASAAAAVSSRVVVQVGAYTEPAKLRDARQKVESLGFKTYTQVIEVDGSKRTRVRVGPFASRAEADQAAARIKASGLPVAVLTL
jgi:DedD protein